MLFASFKYISHDCDIVWRMLLNIGIREKDGDQEMEMLDEDEEAPCRPFNIFHFVSCSMVHSLELDHKHRDISIILIIC